MSVIIKAKKTLLYKNIICLFCVSLCEWAALCHVLHTQVCALAPLIVFTSDCCLTIWRQTLRASLTLRELGMLRSIGRRSVSADNHILWLDRYSLNLADLRNRSQLMTSMREDVHDEWGRKCFGAAVISSPVWNYFDVSRNNEKFAICRLCSK